MGFVPEEKAATTPSPSEQEQKLVPVLHGFGNFAIALSTICILSGGITSFPVGLSSVGGGAIGLGWPLGCLMALAMALTMAEVASAFPKSGGPYQWAAVLGGNGWGWVAGCFNLAGLVTALAAVNVGVCQFVVGSMSRILGYAPSSVPPEALGVAVILMTVSQAFINHWGMRLTSWLTNTSGILIVVVTLGLTAALLTFPVLQGRTPDFSRLLTFGNYSGSAGGNVWPPAENVAWLFALGLLLPAYALTGFDASAQTAEETFEPERNVPRGIVRAVLVSGAAGWLMLSAIVLAAPDLNAAAAAGDQSFFYVIRLATPDWLHGAIYTGIVAIQYVCGLATLTAASRLTWAFGRDHGLPCSRYLRRIGTHHTPSVAIWTICVVVIVFALFVPYTTIAAVCAVFLYIAYALPTACGLLTHGRWPQTGPWHLGRWYRPLAGASVLTCIVLLVLAMQPPNDIAAWVVGAMMVGQVGLWFGWVRTRFRQADPDAPPPPEFRRPGSQS